MAPKQTRGRKTPRAPADVKPKAPRKSQDPRKPSQKAAGVHSNKSNGAVAPPQQPSARATVDPPPHHSDATGPTPPRRSPLLRIIVRDDPQSTPRNPTPQPKSRVVVLRLSPERLRAFPHKKKSTRRVAFDTTPVLHTVPNYADQLFEARSRHWNKRFVGKGEQSLRAEQGLPVTPPSSPPSSTPEASSSRAPAPAAPGELCLETRKDINSDPTPPSGPASPAPTPPRKRRSRRPKQPQQQQSPTPGRKAKRKSAMETTSATPTPQTPAAPAPAAAPRLEDLAPHLFDVAPLTERLLARLLLPSPPMAVPAPGDTPDRGRPAGAGAGQERRRRRPGRRRAGGARGGGRRPEFRRHLDVQQLDAAANAVRATLARARAAALALPDVGRSVAEQRREQATLEARVEKMAGMMRRLRGAVEADVRAAAASGHEQEQRGG